ncbi:hypothetical protein [Cryobacterium sp. BB307]|uniref:hypothetical protein n=1 Tax=Cryobacterium sp. BB307 TaxID=2716317 RepID=UPI001447F42E|nr:hypothetical protein [Cryobacterium sp. BB307]
MTEPLSESSETTASRRWAPTARLPRALCGAASALLVAVVLTGCAWGGVDDEREAAPDISPQEAFDYDEYLVLQQASGITNPPPTTMVRLISVNEANTVWSDCMHEQGYNVFVTFDGGQAAPVDLPESQYEAYELANYICYARYPVDQSTIPVFGDEQINILYSYYVDHLVPCLEANGYPIEYVPSKATFRATFESDQWAPYGAVDAARISDEDWQSLNESCPQRPPDDILYPSDE